jgi:trehalose 6-phosphate phosphatase
MKDVLSRANREVLGRFARTRVLLGFDFDGTLAPITRDRECAVMRPTTRSLLARLARLYPCVVISGRARADVLRRVGNTGVHQVIGEHGMEPWHAHGRPRGDARLWAGLLKDRLERWRGVIVEEKRWSVSVHYGNAERKREARTAVLRAAAALRPARLIGGKDLVNVLPRGAPHKGMALNRERIRWRCRMAIYVGDDETDEDAFASNHADRLLAIRVGARRSSRAPYFIRSQARIDALLRALIELRARSLYSRSN